MTDPLVHGIDRYSQDHLCGQVEGVGTDSRQPAMPITCPLCVVARDVQALTDSVVGCLSSASHLPRWMQAHALGRDTRPILELVARAVLTSDWLTDHDAEVTAIAQTEGRDLERAEWSSWLDSWTGAVGPKPPTVDDVARALRNGPRPFGVACADREQP